jgi:P4 family phage/plasmid primase-like protien
MLTAADSLARFRAAMLERGLSPEEIVEDGELHRFRTIDGKPGTKGGAYNYHPDGIAAGGFQNWEDGKGWQDWCSRTKSEVDPAQWREHLARMAADKKRREAKLAQERAEARTRDAQRWNLAKEGPHPYLNRKGILPHGTRVDRVDGEDRILVPVRDTDGRLHGLQRIMPDGSKLFTSGTAKEGHFFVIGQIKGEPHERVVQVEGFATGATVHESTGLTVVVAFDCGNQLPVAKTILKKYPQIDLAIGADDDWKTTKPIVNPGVTHGQEAARATGARFIKPVWTGDRPEKSTDFDDLARDEGRAVVKAQIDAAFEAAKPAPAEPVAINAELLPAREYGFSESEAARRFGDQIRDRARFAADEGGWYYYDGTRWAKDHGGVWMLEQSLKVSLAYAQDGIRRGSDDPQFQFYMATAKTFNGLAGRKRLIELVRAEPGLAILSSQFDADPWSFNVENGTIDLHTGKLRPHSAADLITKIAAVKYDPKATAPLWERCLPQWLADEETIAFLGRFVGYCLTGSVEEHALLFCLGVGANGKSVVIETLLALWGDYGTLAPISLLMSKHNEPHPCDKQTLKSRRLAAFTETPSGQRWDESTVKALTGGDTITARGMRENYSTFPPTHKIVICGNHMLSAHDSGEAFHRRVRLVPFEQVIPESKRDPKLAEKLRGELPGILNWAIAGCLAWQRDGLGMSARVRAASARYREESDRLAPFFMDACTVVPLARVSRPSLKAVYESWCEREHERPMGPKEFAEQLRQRGITEIKMKVAGVSTRGWQGIGLLSGGQVVTSGQHLPVNRLEEVSRGVNRQPPPVSDHLTTSDDNAQPELDEGEA